MTDRHMHITSFLYDTQERIDAFAQAARDLPDGFFWLAIPVVNDHGRTIAVALFSWDMDGLNDEMQMPQVAEALSGILEYDVEIVSAWEGGDSLGRRSIPRERVWLVRGTASREPVRGEVVRREIGG